VESYVDFFYITNNCMQDFLQGSHLNFHVNSRKDHVFDVAEENLNHLMTRLVKAEEVNNFCLINNRSVATPTKARLLKNI
jgi:hypothetical protein